MPLIVYTRGMIEKVKRLKIHCPAMTLRGGLKAPKTTLMVRYSEHTIGIPWSEVRPLVACAFRHVQKAAFADHREEFLRRRCNSELIIGKSGSRGWWGRNAGVCSRMFIGELHKEPHQTTYPKYKDMPVFWHKDWKEHLVGLAAHELWHRWQPGHGKEAEIMCELVESDAIDTYRREQGYAFTPPVPETQPEPQLVTA